MVALRLCEMLLTLVECEICLAMKHKRLGIVIDADANAYVLAERQVVILCSYADVDCFLPYSRYNALELCERMMGGRSDVSSPSFESECYCAIPGLKVQYVAAVSARKVGEECATIRRLSR